MVQDCSFGSQSLRAEYPCTSHVPSEKAVERVPMGECPAIQVCEQASIKVGHFELASVEAVCMLSTQPSPQ